MQLVADKTGLQTVELQMGEVKACFWKGCAGEVAGHCHTTLISGTGQATTLSVSWQGLYLQCQNHPVGLICKAAELTHGTDLRSATVDIKVWLGINQVLGDNIINMNRNLQALEYPGKEVGPLGNCEAARNNQSPGVLCPGVMAVDVFPDFLVAISTPLDLFLILAFLSQQLIDCRASSQCKTDLGTTFPFALE